MKKIACIICLLTCLLCSAAPTAKDIVIPVPNHVEVGEGELVLHKITLASDNADEVVDYLQRQLQLELGVEAKFKRRANLTIAIDPTCGMAEEAYTLSITKSDISVKSANSAGAFYAVQTLLQLMRAGQTDHGIALAVQDIADQPRFGWRSFMLDEARHFSGKEQVMKLLDEMARLKLNCFHWHLTDDSGWRIEIKQYPLLTEIGSKRSDSEAITWKSGKTLGRPHEGFYTQEEIREVLAYARQRHIQVIPEIEMPGHASASVAAYPWLSCKQEQIEVPILFGKHYHIYNVIDPRVQEFLQNVVTEVIELFECDVIHIGGDEVRFNHWEEDPGMQAYKAKKGFNSFMDIQIEFTNQMSRFIESKGVRMMGWNEVLGHSLHHDVSFDETSTKIAPNVVVQFWTGNLKHLTAAAQDGYQLVNSFAPFTYLDYTYERIPLEKSYSFDPIPSDLAPEHHDNIIGLGTQLWTEWTPTIADMERQIFPRLAAYSEVGWSTVDNKNYDHFVKRLNLMLNLWKARGINCKTDF